MSDGGKGSAPRPLGVPHFHYSDNWDKTFGNRAVNDPTDGYESQDQVTIRELKSELAEYIAETRRLQAIVDSLMGLT